MIEENLNKVLDRVQKACQRAGRKEKDIELIAVTKTVPPDKIAEAVRCGVSQIGENRVQESQDKFPTLHSSFPRLKWHMLGHLQKNKVNRAVQIFDCVQSVDSVKLIEAIDRSAAQLGKVQGCLVEVKVSEEPSKSGLPPEGLEIFLGQCQTFKNIKLQGLMAMAPYFENADRSRPYFSKAKKLFDKFFGPPSSFSLQPPILSMGMSADFEVAIEEGSNMIRVGSAIFGSRTALASA